MGVDIGKLAALLLSQLDQLGSDGTRNLATLAENHTPHSLVHHYKAALALLDSQQVHQRDVLDILAERSNQWRIAHARPYVLNLIEELDEQVVHRQLVLTLLLAYVVDGGAHTAEVGHHRTHHAAGQTAAEQERRHYLVTGVDVGTHVDFGYLEALILEHADDRDYVWVYLTP